jgi:hypothetical protein
MQNEGGQRAKVANKAEKRSFEDVKWRWTESKGSK